MRRSWRNLWTQQGYGEPPARAVAPADLRTRLQAELEQPPQRRRPLTFVHLSIDAYATTLHRSGAAAGAALLDEAEAILLRETRAGSLARLRAPEFALLLPGTDADSARAICDRIRAALPTGTNEATHVGLVTSVDHSLPLPQVMQLAYQGMYDAQRDPTGQIHHVRVESGHAMPYRRSHPPSVEAPPLDPRTRSELVITPIPPRRAG